MRLPFLTLAVAGVLLGTAAVHTSGGSIPVLRALLIFIAALSAHAAVNALNEYRDFRSGLDLKTTRTPVSGGSGTLPRSPGYARLALALGCGLSLVTIVIGLYLALTGGPWLWALGALGLGLIWTYTDYLNRSPLWCYLAPGVGFGVCIVMGTGYALSGAFNGPLVVAGCVVMLLVSNVLLINQLPDRDADASVGRRHLVVVYGPVPAIILYAITTLLAYAILAVSVALGLAPRVALLGLLPALLLPVVLIRLRQASDNGAALIPALGLNVVMANTTPLLLAIALFVAR